MSNLLIATRRIEHLNSDGKPTTALAGSVLSDLSDETYSLLKRTRAGRDLTDAETALHEKLNPKPSASKAEAAEKAEAEAAEKTEAEAAEKTEAEAAEKTEAEAAEKGKGRSGRESVV